MWWQQIQKVINIIYSINEVDLPLDLHGALIEISLKWQLMSGHMQLDLIKLFNKK